MEQESQSARHDFDLKMIQISSENNSLKEKFIKIIEEHKAEMSLNSKTLNSIVKMHEKALEDKSNEIMKLKKEIQCTKHEFDMKSNQMSTENNSLKEKVVEFTEEHKAAMSSEFYHTFFKCKCLPINSFHLLFNFFM